MKNDNVIELSEQVEVDPLTQVLKEGARKLLKEAVEAEVKELLESYSEELTVDGRKAVVRNGYLPEREIVTGIGPISVKVPKVRDRNGTGIKFNSQLLPPYLKKTRSVEELLPWLYLKGVSTGDFQEALGCLLGEGTKGLSPSVISRLKKEWESEYKQWIKRDLSGKEYVYIWADGINFNIRGDEDSLSTLVIIGATAEGKKEIISIDGGYRESEQSWYEVLIDLKSRGLTAPPSLAIGDGALGFWKAVKRAYPETKHQRCWVHKISNILNKLPKSAHPKAKEQLKEIYMAESKENAEKAIATFVEMFEAKYPKATKCLEKDTEALLEFFNFPAEHWGHLRTTNPIESTFATVRLRTAKTRGAASRSTILALVFKLIQSAQKRWNRLRGYKKIADVITGVKFVDGKKIDDNSDKIAA